MSARLLVTGGRAYPHRDKVFAELDALHARVPVVLVIHGACLTGADLYAKEWARARGIPDDPHPARWDDIDAPGAKIRFNGRGRPYNLLAGFARNGEMLRTAMPTHAIAFPGAGGTNDMVAKIHAARRAGREIELIDLRIPSRATAWSGNGPMAEYTYRRVTRNGRFLI